MNVPRAEMFALPIWDLCDELNDTALCAALPELHDGPEDPASESSDDRAAREHVARQVCEECPARAFCLDYAVQVRPDRGIWAGFSLDEIADIFPIALGEVA